MAKFEIDLKPEENIFFKLTIIPFGQTSSPDLKQWLKIKN